MGNSPDKIAKKQKAASKSKKGDGLKQTKLNFSKAKKKCNPWSDESDVDVISDLSDVEVAPRERTAGSRRAAAAKANFTYDDEDSASDSDLSLHSNDGIDENEQGPMKESFLDDTHNGDESSPPPKNGVSKAAPKKKAPRE